MYSSRMNRRKFTSTITPDKKGGKAVFRLSGVLQSMD